MGYSKRINPAAIVALKEALSVVYWYKKDLRTFLTSSLTHTEILATINWEDYKREIVDKVISILTSREEDFQDDLLNLITATCSITDFSHLSAIDDGPAKVRKAQEAVNALRELAKDHQALFEQQQQTAKARALHAEQLAEITTFKHELQRYHEAYCQLVLSTNAQERGYKLEKLLIDLAALFDLDPRASYKITGEQIDGAFTLGNTDFIFEAKWQNEPVRAKELDSLASKVQRKLDNTLGLFLSISGFSEDAISAYYSSGRRVLLLMDGSDLNAVLEGRIDYRELLLRKRRAAAQTGDIYYRFADMS